MTNLLRLMTLVLLCSFACVSISACKNGPVAPDAPKFEEPADVTAPEKFVFNKDDPPRSETTQGGFRYASYSYVFDGAYGAKAVESHFESSLAKQGWTKVTSEASKDGKSWSGRYSKPRTDARPDVLKLSYSEGPKPSNRDQVLGLLRFELNAKD